jgi:hypothetical protein
LAALANLIGNLYPSSGYYENQLQKYMIFRTFSQQILLEREFCLEVGFSV